MTEFRVQSWPWLLLIVPTIAAGWYFILFRKRPAVVYSSVDLLRELPRTIRQRLRSCLPWLRLLAFCGIIIGLARPQQGLQEFRIRTEGVAIEMCIDKSGSMRAMDFEVDGEPVNRLVAVKKVFRDFVLGEGDLQGRPDDLIGLIAFGGFAEGRAPLTLDHGALIEVLDSVQIPNMEDARGQRDRKYFEEELATAIGDAVALGVDRLKDSNAKSKVIILLSDGESNAGVVSPLEAANAAKSFGIKIYTIGVGSTGFAPMPAIDAFGRRVLARGRVRLDEATLKEIARVTEGEYFNAKSTEALQQVYERIDELEKTETEGRLYTEYRELFPWFVWPSLVILLVERALALTLLSALP